MKSTLNKTECKLARAIGRLRQESNVRAGLPNTLVADKSGYESHEEGFAAELAVAKVLNLYPDFTISPRSGGYDLVAPSGLTIDVKVTDNPQGNLIAYREKKRGESDVYILVIGKMPDYYLAGWAYDDELINEDKIDELGDKKVPTYRILREDLRPMSALKELLY